MKAHLSLIHLLTLCVIVYFPVNCQVESSGSNCSDLSTAQDGGSIQSPNYQGNPVVQVFRNYAVSVSCGKQVSLEFEATEIDGVQPPLGYFLLFDGPDCMCERIAALYYLSSERYISNGNQMTALHISDTPVDGNFSIHYNAVTEQTSSTPSMMPDILINCGGEQTANTGNITFLRMDFVNHQLCIWRITVSSGSVVKLNITTLMVNGFSASLRVLDGGDCGSHLMLAEFNPMFLHPTVLTSSSNVMTVVLSSAGYVYVQFEASYHSAPRSYAL